MKKIFLMFYLMTSLQILAYMNIYPVNFDKRIDGIGEVEEYVIANSTNKTLKYRVCVENGDITNNMSNWIELYPDTLILKGGETGKIKVYINSPENTPVGEYSAIIGIKEIGVPNINKENKKNLEVFTNLKMKVYGYVGELPINLEYKDIKVLKNGEFFGEIKNNSQRRVYMEILFIKGKEISLLYEKRLRKDEVLNLSEIKINKKQLEDGKIVIKEKGKAEILKTIKI